VPLSFRAFDRGGRRRALHPEDATVCDADAEVLRLRTLPGQGHVPIRLG